MNNKIWNDFGIFGKRDDNRILDSHPLFGNKRQSYGPSFIVHRSSPGFMIHKRPWLPFAVHHNLQKKVHQGVFFLPLLRICAQEAKVSSRKESKL